jgi:hypothetical protein
MNDEKTLEFTFEQLAPAVLGPFRFEGIQSSIDNENTYTLEIEVLEPPRPEPVPPVVTEPIIVSGKYEEVLNPYANTAHFWLNLCYGRKAVDKTCKSGHFVVAVRDNVFSTAVCECPRKVIQRFVDAHSIAPFYSESGNHLTKLAPLTLHDAPLGTGKEIEQAPWPYLLRPAVCMTCRPFTYAVIDVLL